jgi:hypothetical protein
MNKNTMPPEGRISEQTRDLAGSPDTACCAIFILGVPVNDAGAFKVDIGELDSEGRIIRFGSSIRTEASSSKTRELIEVFLESVKLSSDRVRESLLQKVRYLPIPESDGRMLDFGFIVPVQIELGDVIHAKGLAAYLNVDVHNGGSSNSLHNV